ncbi:DUF2111 domain-containing protein [Methanococcus maripaludis]|uniref:DUF2111 domain-containing protein n=2 Tax=Methanococcus maripaludis TaxID=39152 RepID=A0A7J9PGX1_METMI|nr:DUF2111 domain-containing protein [Methanococcus maripaludis]MBA2862351.1 hypothetical protein [Methanococcus maripaludis]
MLDLKCTSSKDIFPLAYAIHVLVNKSPVTMRSKDKPGVRIEKGKLIDDNYEGYVLKQVLEVGEVLKVTPICGPYAGVPVVVVPVKDGEKIIAAIGIVDLTAGIFEEIHSITRRKELARFLPDEAFPK